MLTRATTGPALWAILLFGLLYGALTLLWRVPLPVGAAYLALSLWSFVLYALDKSAARSGRWRIRERTLHVWALLGGWPGALLAQHVLRHKSSKVSFRAVFWLTVLVNLAGLVLLSSPQGGSWHWLR